MKIISTPRLIWGLLGFFLLLNGSTLLAEDNKTLESWDPCCHIPHDLEIGCNTLPYDFNPYNRYQREQLFGKPHGHGYCQAQYYTELNPIVELNDCSVGKITRKFEVPDRYGNNIICKQVIWVNAVHDYAIKFPKDGSANCGAAIEAGGVGLYENACDLLAVSQEDQIFSASGNDCYKIRRTYRVLNWCEYDGYSDPIAVRRNEDCAGSPGDEDVWLIVRPNGVTYIDRNGDETDNDPYYREKSTDCDGLSNPKGHWINSEISAYANPPRNLKSRGFWEYVQFLKVSDSIPPEIIYAAPEPVCSYDNINCNANITALFSINENCTPNDLTIKVFLDAGADGDIDENITSTALSGTYPNYQISGKFPIGNHAFEVHVEDGCGTSNSEYIAFSILDCTVPSPICISVMALPLMPVNPPRDVDGDGQEDVGMAEIWATDVIGSAATPDCSGEVTYSINRKGETASPDQASLIVTCADANDIVIAELHTWDGEGNTSYCEMTLDVQAHVPMLCAAAVGSVAGFIQTEDEQRVTGVDVRGNNYIDQYYRTEGDGAYVLSGFAVGDSVAVQPILNTGHMNGVTTYDMLLLSRHILGMVRLDSPYKLIAGDVNNSGNLSALDIVHLQRAILGIHTTFTYNTSWRFVRSDYVFPDSLNPWVEEFPEIIEVKSIPPNSPVLNANFIAIKIGDLSGDVNTGLETTDDRSINGTFNIQAGNVTAEADEELKIDFWAKDLTLIEGLQYTLNIETSALEILDVEYGVFQNNNLGTQFMKDGLVSASWYHLQTSIGDQISEKPLFSLLVKTKKGGELRDWLSIDSRVTKAEAYGVEGSVQDVQLAFNESKKDDGLALYNAPNPFRTETQIKFYLPQTTKAKLTLTDLNGKILKTIEGNFDQGWNQWSVQATDLPANGLWFYTLWTPEQTITKRMVLLD